MVFGLKGTNSILPLRGRRWLDAHWEVVRRWWQRRTRGWDDSETWSLDYELAKWMLPRLKRFREITDGYPSRLTLEEWNLMLDEMIWAFEFRVNDDDWSMTHSKGEKWKRYEHAMQLFVEWQGYLWW
jgi:hypothetical protein